MFTGLVRSRGEIRRIEGTQELTLEILPRARDFLLSIGASVACNGICLTVATVTPEGAFTVTLSAETLRMTTAGTWKTGRLIHLEPALNAGDPLGGHYVSGHVDGLAKVTSLTPNQQSVVLECEIPLKLARFIAPKGSVTLDGVSLTVNAVQGNRFTVNLIPHTRDVTHLGTLAAGDLLNLEVDMIARYIARMMEIPA